MDLKEKIGIYEGYPKEGISFKDINPLLHDADAFRCAIDSFYNFAKALDVNLIIIPEARGYIFGSALAYRLGAGLVPVRKPGKLPGEVVTQDYALEYGTNTIEIQKDAIKVGDRVLIVDDLIATGGTTKAAIDLIEKLGGEVAGCCFVIELTELGGRELLKDYLVSSLVEYPV